MCAQARPPSSSFTAFDQRTTPEFQAKVVRISADLTTEQQTGVSFYVARLALDDDVTVRASKGELALVPGMPAEVHIRTGDRTAFSYFLKPLADQFSRAFIEQ